MSGCTDDELVRRGLRRDGVQFLAKPFATSSLAAAVARALAET